MSFDTPRFLLRQGFGWRVAKMARDESGSSLFLVESQFLMRGKENVTGEWNLVCTAYNLKRTLNLIKAQAAIASSGNMLQDA
jgi:hypothetical protein